MTITLGPAAVAANGVIGRGGGLPWHLPEDLARFKRLTIGHVVVMGRRTYESIGRPLPGRTTIVLTRQPQWTADGVEVAATLDDALSRASGIDVQVFLVGGTQVFADGSPIAHRMALTLIDQEAEGDTYFATVDWSQWREVQREVHDGFTFVDYERR